ncbi:low temperature requirement protein A [Nocardioides nitrophenolicus]|uniref:low temperature requirement protein A n=1 Tax=Nocardioides nitrophenolicus TaxID=60489 RepID=UPI00195B7FFD|nr:low temperature requirement protein A [Nocardioides nitrophenolicus]MBM7519686.1 low temperature requirement protein LtrA [Nocardioides nitrophenolicus]
MKSNEVPLNPVDAGVAPLELYFDLVFVFAITQITVVMAHDLGAESILRGALLLGLIWSGWAGYAWLGNLAVAHASTMRNLVLTAMAAIFVLALSIPEAFHDARHGLDGPWVVASCYLVFRTLHLWMYWRLSASDPPMRSQLTRFAPAVLCGTALMFCAAATHGAVQTWLWVAALAADFVGIAVGGARGWRLRSTSHFSERHGQILIIALGESILAIGVAVRGDAISWPIIATAVLGLLVATALWWIYFDVTATQAEHRLRDEPADTRARLAGNAYSLLHLPMVLGIVLTALGLKKVVQYAGADEHHTLRDPLEGFILLALLGGIILYLLAHAAFRTVLGLGVYRGRLLAVAALALLWLLGPHLPGHTMLILVAATMASVIIEESVTHAGQRSLLAAS